MYRASVQARSLSAFARVCAGKAPVPRGARKGPVNALADHFPETFPALERSTR